MRNKVVQISLFDIYTDVLDAAEENKNEFIRLLEEHIDLDELIPARFYNAFYSWTGRKRIHSLKSFIKALLLQRILGIPSVSLLRTIIALSKELRDYCGFITIPDAPQFSRFKSEFEIYIEAFFEHLVDFTAPICRELDEKKSQYLIYDTTGIEACVKENNDKHFNNLLKKAKAMAKGNPDCDPYKLVYALYSDTAEKDNNAKHQYINGHFCYAYKAGIVTDGLGIIRHISFFDDDFREKHPEVNTPKSDNPDKDKEIGDSTALKPVLSDFFEAHPDLKYHTFLGDSACDSYDNYSMLKNEFHFERACIPLNKRNSQSSHTDFNEYGNPVCPLTGEQFICLGKSGGKNRSMRYKWVCPKSVQDGNTRKCVCETPCTDSSYGRCVYTYPDKNFRDCPGIPRNTEHWDNLYKHRVLVERTINIFKDSFGLDSIKTRNPKTIKADLYLAGCAQLIGVILAKAIHQDKLYKSVRKIIAMTA